MVPPSDLRSRFAMQKRGQELRNVQHIERKGVNKPFRRTRLERIIPLRGATPLRSVVVEGNHALDPTVGGKGYLLDAHFRVLEKFIAALFQRFASFVKPDRFVERDRALFQLIDDLLEFSERRLERHCRDVRPGLGHGAAFRPLRCRFNRAKPKLNKETSKYRLAASHYRRCERKRPRSRPSDRCGSAPD